MRPPVAQDRIRLTPTGQILLHLRHRWADGTTHLLFEPIELLERLAALTPRPRINLLLYYGVLGAHAAWRSRLSGHVTVEQGCGGGCHAASPPAARAVPLPASTAPMARGANVLWASLMQRSFGFDVLACPRCGSRLRLIALIEDPPVIRRILAHLGLPTDVPARRPSRAPPLLLEGGDDERVEAPLGAAADRIRRRVEDDLAIP